MGSVKGVCVNKLGDWVGSNGHEQGCHKWEEMNGLNVDIGMNGGNETNWEHIAGRACCRFVVHACSAQVLCAL